MRVLASAALALALGLPVGACTEPSTPPPRTAANEATPTAPAPVHDEKWKTRAPDSECQASLDALAHARLETWKGLGKCGRVDAEAAIGSSGDQPSRFEQFGEYRAYPHQGGTILVWFLAEDIRVVQLLYPKLARPLGALLGPPEAKVASQLSSDWEQWVYASRGLTAHVKKAGGDVVTLFAYRPSSVDAFLQTDIARVAKSESPLEDLK